MMDAHGLTLPLLLLSPFLAWGAVVLAQLGMYWRGHRIVSPSLLEIHQDDALRSQQRLMRMEREEMEKRDWDRRLEQQTGLPRTWKMPPVDKRIWSHEEIEYAYGASQRHWQRDGEEWKAYRDLVRRGMWS